MLCETELVWGSEDLQAQPELGAKQKKREKGKGLRYRTAPGASLESALLSLSWEVPQKEPGGT